MNTKVFRLKITLIHSHPAIWRQVWVNSEILLSDLHKVIQAAMGWENAHLHQFIKDGAFYLPRMKEDDFWNDLNNIDYMGIRLDTLISTTNDTIIYEYDFGDSWEHEILLEQIDEADALVKYPICTGGERNCPPEDSGGIPGYMNLLKILKDPKHKDYESIMDWLDENFDPEFFDLKKVNKGLQRMKAR